MKYGATAAKQALNACYSRYKFWWYDFPGAKMEQKSENCSMCMIQTVQWQLWNMQYCQRLPYTDWKCIRFSNTSY